MSNIHICSRPMVMFACGLFNGHSSLAGKALAGFQNWDTTSNFEEIVTRRAKDVTRRGYNAFINLTATHKDFEDYIYCPSTAGIVWCSHGADNHFTAYDGKVVGLVNSKTITVYSGNNFQIDHQIDLERVMNNKARFGMLKWILLLGCAVGNQETWRKALGCDVYTFDFDVRTLDAYRMLDNETRIWDLVRSVFPEPKTDIELTDLINQLPQVPHPLYRSDGAYTMPPRAP